MKPLITEAVFSMTCSVQSTIQGCSDHVYDNTCRLLSTLGIIYLRYIEMLPCCKTVIYSVWNCAMIHYTAPYWLHLITFSGRKSRDKKLRLCLDVSQFKKFFLPPNCDWHGFLCKSFNPFSWLRQTLVLYKRKGKAQMILHFSAAKVLKRRFKSCLCLYLCQAC